MFTKLWMLSTFERLAKSFLQGYVAYWTLAAGLGNTPADANASAFDLLFTLDNVKAGIVVAFLSFATSIASTGLGPDKDSPSLVVTETEPAVVDEGV